MNDSENSTAVSEGYPKSKLIIFEKRLQDMRTKAVREFNFLTSITVNENGTSNTGHSFEVVENASESSSKENNSILAERQNKLINNIDNALILIKKGTYGICRITGVLIPEDRLLVAPFATTCIKAKIEENKEKKEEFLAQRSKMRRSIIY